jgi:hypothetical protein
MQDRIRHESTCGYAAYYNQNANGIEPMKTIIRLEELGLFLFSIYLFTTLSFPWWFFPLFLFAPDLSMLGYSAGPRIGAYVYNLVHHRALALLYYVAGMLLPAPVLALIGVIIFAHSSLDRALGYGLKLTNSFNDTHLGKIGHEDAKNK